MGYGPQKPGSASEEPTVPEPTVTELTVPSGESLCLTCTHAATCAVRITITLVAPEGGIEIGACGVYWPIENETPTPD